MEARRSTQISTRGIYKAADGRYRSAGTFSTEKRVLAVAEEAERHAAEVAGGAAGGLDPGTRATRTIKEYAPLFLRHHQVEGNTKDTYADTLRLHVIPFLGGPSSGPGFLPRPGHLDPLDRLRALSFF